MTAWIVVVLPMCLMAKCTVDFIALEYGVRFQFISDDYLLVICSIMCAYALFVDIVNLIGSLMVIDWMRSKKK